MSTATTTLPARIARGVLQFGLLSLAFFIPFSIAGESIAIGVATLGWLTLAVLRRAGWAPDDGAPSPLRDPVLWATVLLVVAAVPSVFMSEEIGRAAHDWGSYWLFVALFLVARNVEHAGLRGAFVRVVLASSVGSCLLAFAQRAGGFRLGFIHVGYEHRVGGTLYTMTFAGILSLLVVFFAAASLRGSMPKRERVILAGGAVVQFAALLLTMTRGAYLAVLAGIATVLVLMRNRGAAIAAALLIAGMAAFSFTFSRDYGRAISLPQLVESAPDANMTTRLVLWDIAWDLFREHPVLGVGFGDYEMEARRRIDGRKVLTTTDSHNIYLQTLATEGLVGFIPFVLFWVVMIRELQRTRRSEPRGSLAWGLATGAIAVCVTVLVGALTEDNIDDEEVFIALMALLGLARSAWYASRRSGPVQ